MTNDELEGIDMELSEEITTLAHIMRHRGLVQAQLTRLAYALEGRALTHDLSKFSADEFEGLTEINRVARIHPYGSSAYMESLKNNKAIDLHFARNRHHPEYFPDGVDGMNLLDFIEMVIDWKAANIVHGQPGWEEVLQIQFNRFHLSPEQIYLVRMISALLTN